LKAKGKAKGKETGKGIGKAKGKEMGKGTGKSESERERERERESIKALAILFLNCLGQTEKSANYTALYGKSGIVCITLPRGSWLHTIPLNSKLAGKQIG
jgi:hypothetical protein